MKTYHSKTLNKKITIPQPTIFIIREISKSDNPADKGTELKRFTDWNEAKEYRDNLWLDDEIKSYVSEEVDKFNPKL